MLKNQSSPLKYPFLAIGTMFFIVLMGVFMLAKGTIIAQTAGSSSADEALIANLNKQIEEQRAKIDAMAENIEKYNSNIKSARSQQTSLQNQVYIINNQIAKANLDIAAKEEGIKTTELEIKKVEIEIKSNEQQIEKNKTQLAAFIRQLNFYDQKSYLAVLLSNDSFSEFFDQIKNLEGVNESLKKTLNKVQELVGKLNNQKEDLSKKRDQLSELLSKLEDEKAILGGQKNTKQYLITETKNSERKFQILVENLKQEQMAANSAAANLERRLRAELEKRGAKEKFNSFGDAALGWPTNSRRTTATFHDPDYPYRNLFEHSGLDIGIPQGTPVMAAEDGYVAKVALGTKWYGSYVMIIHNNNLATLYGHLSSAGVKNDQYVSKGQVIGYSGNTGFSSGPHLHFEVRYNGIPVNPLSYLP